MKKLLTIVAAVMMLVGVAGNAMAFFEMGDLQLVAYEGQPFETTGNEAHFDLGVGRDTTIGYSNVGTGITLSDFGATAWTDIKVGVFGGGRDAFFNDVPALFGSDTDAFSMGNPFGGYQDATVFNSNLDQTAWGPNQKEVLGKADGPYHLWMQLGTTPGIYSALLINPATSFGAEAVMNGGIVGDYDLYEFDLFTRDLAKAGTFTFDTAGAELLVSYNPVPVPAAVWLLGSGLLALIGIRRRNH
jgi:hypothetical protein